MSKYSIYRAVLNIMIILLLLTLLSLLLVEPNTAPYYITLITLFINLPVTTFIIIRLVVAYKRNERLDAEEFKLKRKDE